MFHFQRPNISSSKKGEGEEWAGRTLQENKTNKIQVYSLTKEEKRHTRRGRRFFSPIYKTNHEFQEKRLQGTESRIVT